MDQSANQPSFKIWGAPAVGEYLCLSSVPGTPVYARPRDGLTPPALIGYTKSIVAFNGWQNGEDIGIVYYTGGVGWIDGHKITPFQAAYPGQRCIVPGLHRNLRPIFEID